MTKVKNLLLTILLLCGTTIWGNNGLRISGRIKVLKPTTLQIKDMNEGVVLSCIIGTNNTFSTDEINIIPDVYKLYLGETEQNVYLENNPITINGYFDEKNPEQSSLSFTGIDPFLTLQNYMPCLLYTSPSPRD